MEGARYDATKRQRRQKNDEGDPDDPTYGANSATKFEKELVTVNGPRWKLMQKLAVQCEDSFEHDGRCKWSRNARKTVQHKFRVPEICVYTDFAAQQECHGQDRATCGTSAHVNKCIFVVLSNPRTVKVEVNGSLVDKRIHDCDTWTFFLPASGKHKENDFVAHHICLRHVVDYYQSKLKARNITLERVWLFTDGCPGQYACRQNYCEVSHFPLKEQFQDAHLVHVRSITVCSRYAVHNAAHSHLYLSALR